MVKFRTWKRAAHWKRKLTDENNVSCCSCSIDVTEYCFRRMGIGQYLTLSPPPFIQITILRCPVSEKAVTFSAHS